tara:strand:- start:2295 stop:2663 length:369 start_codon:yes stop_codon:yes gene_type:complete
MSQFSIEAYIDVLPKIKPTEKLILQHISNWGSCGIKGISKAIPLPLQTASARLSELHDQGIVYQLPTGEYAISDPSYVDQVKTERLEAKYLKWKKLGDRYEWHFRYDTFDKNGKPPLPQDYE